MTSLHRPLTSRIFILSLLSLASSTLPPLAKVHRIEDGIPQNIIILQNSNITIVGGKNAIYKFTPDLELVSELSTGPQLDNPSCPPDPLHCEDERTLSDNDNKVLLQFGQYPIVLSCGSIWQGTCYLLNVVRNISVKKEFDKALYVNYVASREETVAFFGEGDRKTVLFSASTYDGRPLMYHPYSVAARAFTKDTLVLAVNERNRATFIDIARKWKTAYKVHYIYGFAYDGFAYFLIVQNTGAALTTFETRLARVCMKDQYFFTYTEVPLKCSGDEKVYSIAEVASLHATAVSARKRRQSGLDDDGMTLSVAFGKPFSGTGHVNDPSLGSGLCQYKMKDVVAMFNNTIVTCNKGGLAAAPLMLLHGEPGLRCREYKPTGNLSFCEAGENSYVGSNLHLPGTLTVTLKDSLMTSLLMLSQGDGSSLGNLAWIGDNNGRLYKYKITGKKVIPLYSADISQQEESVIQPRIRKSVAVNADETAGYFLTGRSVVKFPIASCSIHDSCAACMRAFEDPLGCGWCDGKCAHKGECDGNWVKAMCPIRIDKVYPTKGPVTGGTLLTMEGENLGTQHEPDLSSVSVTVGGALCPIHWWNFTVIQCRVPAVDNPMSAEISISVVDTAYSDERPYDIDDKQFLEEPFQYTNVSISRMNPTFGPLSGGTNLVIGGTNLDSGATHRVTIGIDRLCEIQSISSDTVTCKTPDMSTAVYPSSEMQVTYLIDDSAVPWSCRQSCASKSLFKYYPDPVIESAGPRKATFAGGTNITVHGRNLNSVQSPRLVFQSESSDGGNTISTLCHNMYGGHIMTCVIPSIYNSNIVSEERIKTNLPIFVRGHFQMDSLIRGAGPNQTFFNFVYLADAVFETFAGEGNESEVTLDDLTLEIPGKNLDSIFSKKDVNVKVGDVDFACNVTNIQPTALFCFLNPDDFREESEHHVEVILAGRSYTIGTLRLIPAKMASHTGLIAAIVVVIFITVMVVVGVVYYIRNRQKKRVPEYLVDFSNRGADGIRTPGSNDYVRPNDAEAREALMAPAFELDSDTRAMLESEKILFKREYLILGPVIGQGHFGCVYRGTLELEGKGEVLSVAVKTLHNNSRGAELDGQAFLEEALLMKDFHHTNVLSLIGLCVDTDGQLMVITPYMKYGDLLSYIRDERNSPTVKDLITYGIHIAEGMNYLSSQKFVHRDLAARNCMLSEDFTVHVADFGLSRDVYEKDYYSGDNKKTKLPVKWMALESLEKGIYNHKTDVWAYGVVLWELMTRGVTPYPEVDNWDIVNFLKQGRRMQQPSFCPDMLYEIMLQCWEEDPKKRPSFSRLVQEVTNVITTLQKKKRDREVGLKVTYVNYPRAEGDDDDGDEGGPSHER